MTQQERRFLNEKLFTAKYRFAEAMPDEPHYYTLRKEWDDDYDFMKCVALIQDCGYRGHYKGTQYMYLPLGDYYYWTMCEPINQYGKPWTVLINRARKEDAKMGLIGLLRCPKCGYHTTAYDWFFGFADNKYYTEEYRDSVLAKNPWLRGLYEMMDHPSVHYEHTLCMCTNCKKLSDEMRVLISSDQGSFVSRIYCDSCGDKMMEFPSERWDSVPCPECAKQDELVILEHTPRGIGD